MPDNNTRILTKNNPRRYGVEYLITAGMGYCCTWKFFQLYHDTSLIAARLGVSERSVRRHKAAAADSLRCMNCPNCMKSISK